MAVTGEFLMTDETGATELLRIAAGGARVGINGAPDSSHILTINGSTIIRSDGFAFDATVIPTSAGPVVGSVTIANGSTATISTGLTQQVIATSEADTSSLNTSNFVLANNTGSSKTYDYSYW